MFLNGADTSHNNIGAKAPIFYSYIENDIISLSNQSQSATI